MPQKTKKKNTKKVTKKVDIDEELTVSEEFKEESSRVKLFFMELKNNPKKAFTTLGAFIKRVFYNNKLFFLFIFLNVVNGFLLRLFTINVNNNAFRLDTLLADFSFILIIGSFSFFMKKRKYGYLRFMTIFLSLICIINSVYYTYYTSFTSITHLLMLRYMISIGNAVVENVFQIKDLIYVIAPIVFIVVKKRYDKAGYLEKVRYYARHKKRGFTFLFFGLLSLGIFFSTCTGTDFGRLDKQWNREYIVTKYGIYVYHVNDLVKSIEPKLVSIFGYDNALRNFNIYFDERKDKYNEKNKYTNIYEGKNLIVIHAESLQQFVIGMKFNGQEVTPNLNKLSKKGIYFDNFYTQVSVGTSSDTEFTFNTTLMPANYGTAFGNFSDKKYVTIPNMLKEKGYYAFSMHGNNGDFWNRRIMHANLGYDMLYAKNTYVIDEEIGLGISDVSFFKQSVEKLKTINEEHDKFFGYVITLTNHTPFSDTDKYGEFDVDIKEKVYNKEKKQYEEVSHPYMEGTKLGRYLKSVHYADYALGVFFDELDKAGLLENTVIAIYGDHDARLPEEDYVRLYNYDTTTDSVRSKTDPKYVEVNDYTYELNRKTPFIIWSKKNEDKATKVSYYMGMYDVLPTLGNMFGFHSDYSLGHDIFNIKDENIITFPTGNWLTKEGYYNAQKSEFYPLPGSVIGDDYIASKTKYADDLLKVSNDILVYDLIRNSQEASSDVKENDLLEDVK